MRPSPPAPNPGPHPAGSRSRPNRRGVGSSTACVPPDVSRARRMTTLARWSVPFDYGGQAVEVRGRVVYEPVRGAVTTRLRGSTRPFRDVEVQLAPGRVPALF